LPALIGVTDAINEPRYTSLKGVMGAKKKPLDVLALADLGLDPDDVGAAGSRTEVLALGEPPARPAGTRIEDDGRAAEAIVDFLVEKQLV
jgi:electron transfer flavoprotein beta subunit